MFGDDLRKDLMKENMLLWLLVVVFPPLMIYAVNTGDRTFLSGVVVLATAIAVLKELMEEKAIRRALLD